jgi:DNA mismatch repair protein MutS
MTFYTDKQTQEDLNVSGKFKAGSLFNLFNRAKTRGGEIYLEDLFSSPLTDRDSIKARILRIRYLQETDIHILADRQKVEMVTKFLTESRPQSILSSYLFACKEKVNEWVYQSDQYSQFQQQMNAVQHLLDVSDKILNQCPSVLLSASPYAELFKQIKNTLEKKELRQNVEEDAFTLHQFAKSHFLFLNRNRDDIERLLQAIYELDAYVSVAEVAKQKKLTYPEVLEGEDVFFDAKNLRHPSLTSASGNDFRLDSSGNLFFLTGANMAGKSTLMKTIGVSFYLSHMGFPVAADHYAFCPMEGILSSINVADDISAGWSHFYAEVMRVKIVASKVSAGTRLLVLFDELFKGTNVKDAYDGTKAITELFAKYRRCGFVISTHIIEVGQALQSFSNIRFGYLPTIMTDNSPRYTYKLTHGITSDRHGMLLLENEGVFEMLKKVISKQVTQC